MIRIQKLKQPKNTSGDKVLPNKSLVVDKVKIVNQGSQPIYVDTYTRKKYLAAPKKKKKAA